MEIILLKLGEIVLKGLNRGAFEKRMRQNLARRLKHLGDFKVYILQSTVYVEPLSDVCDMDAAYRAAKQVFGAVTISRARMSGKSIQEIFENARDYLGDELRAAKSFKVETKRSDKSFPMTSIKVSQEVGGLLHDAFPHLTADMHEPDYTVYIEIREPGAYVHSRAESAAGGLPIGMGGRAGVLLSGGIDSPVAAYMMAKRGVELEMVHFFSYPYTSVQARDKVLELAGILCGYCGRMTVNIVPFTKIQEAIRDCCPEEYSTLIMRRKMMRIAERLVREDGCMGLITGESMGQVASQTMQAMAVTGEGLTMPVFRPLIGMDKEEIIKIARKIGTFDTSILPYEDCCTVFTPKHPRTRPELEGVLKAEAGVDWEPLMDEALRNVERVGVKFKY